MDTTAQSRNQNSTIKIAGAIIVLAILAGGGGWYWWIYQEGKKAKESQEFVADFSKVDTQYHRTGDYNEAIPALEELAGKTGVLSGKQHDVLEVKVLLRLAANYIGRNNPGDREKAMEIYRSIVADKSIPSTSRGIALAEMTSVVHWVGGDQEVQQLVFTTEPYAAILKDQKGDVHAAIEKMYEMSNDLFPNALAHFQIALMESQHLVNMPSATAEEKKSMAESISSHVKSGDELYAKYPYENSYKAHMYLCRSMSLATLRRFLPGQMSVSEVEDSFKQAVEIAAAAPNDFYSRSVGITIPMYYSVFLNNALAGTRQGDVQNLLKIYTKESITNSDFRILNSYTAAVGSRPDDDFFKTRLLKLAKENSSFKDYLVALGWKI